MYGLQWRSQNAGKVKHIKGRVMNQVMILYNNVPLKWELLLKEEFAPRGSEFFPLRAVPYEKITLTTLGELH